jgi:hypothetical protein
MFSAAADLTTAVVDWARDLGGDVFNAAGSGSGPGGGNYGGAGASGAGGAGGGGGSGPRPGAPTLAELMDLMDRAARQTWDTFWEGVQGDPDGLSNTMTDTGRNAALELHGQRMGNTGLTTVVGAGIDALIVGPAVYGAANAEQAHNRRNEEQGLDVITRERNKANPNSDSE